MKKITVLSDTHGNRAAIDSIKQVLCENDMVIHLGDVSQDGSYIKKFNPNTYCLNGNCDLMRTGEEELVIKAEEVKIFACHGHRYSVKSTLTALLARAKNLGCNVALFGHTHRACELEENGILVVNPGNMSKYSRNSYCYLVIDGEKAVAKIVYTDERKL